MSAATTPNVPVGPGSYIEFVNSCTASAGGGGKSRDIVTVCREHSLQFSRAGQNQLFDLREAGSSVRITVCLDALMQALGAWIVRSVRNGRSKICQNATDTCGWQSKMNPPYARMAKTQNSQAADRLGGDAPHRVHVWRNNSKLSLVHCCVLRWLHLFASSYQTLKSVIQGRSVKRELRLRLVESLNSQLSNGLLRIEERRDA
ncbi:hypothetical protein HNR00_003547 [Methylorubrum rhodinum]|uniref:Uncharacterized protein n=1 Tax=Methylorubrum rhodinum TaxID=29428 RepID=A0A840ZNC5_9HYPH|nr:hypothetical protein [Methylorubrum rhodinum]MBB5758820.1 hypothetical protein [Methylorubrum rhodinum]